MEHSSKQALASSSISTPPGMRFVSDWLVSKTPEEREDFLRSLTPETLAAFPYLFDVWALPHQLPPEGGWRTWVILGGRGAGKTRAGSEWVRAQVEGAGPRDAGLSKRVALVGETYDQVRDVMVFGDSGIMACSPPDRRPEWIESKRKLVWPNGAEAQAFQTVGKSILDTVYNAAVQPVSSHMGGVLAEGLGSVLNGMLAFADGGAFSNGKVMPFANGGVVSGPNYFPMRGGLGLMGEAGPEAIMPLTRGANGKLGVMAQGGGQAVNVTMNITTPDVAGFRRSQGQIAQQVGRVINRGNRYS